MADIRFKALRVVIEGKEHSPTIIHPHFFRHQGIVPAGMEYKEAGVITTPAFSQVPYRDGLQVQIWPKRARFSEQLDGSDGCEEKVRVPDIAKRYLRKVPLIRYTALDIHWLVSVGLAKGQLSTMPLVKQGDWLHMEEKMPSVSVRLIYPLGGGRDIEAIIEPDSGQGAEGRVLLSGNFHHPIETDADSHETAIGILDGWEGSLADFRKLADNIARGASA